MTEKSTGLKRTPLYPFYQEEKIRLVDFGGWALPVQFSSILQEHRAVREKAGLFDCSHMGEISIKGEDAEFFLNRLLTNDVSTMEDGSVQYNLFCKEEGGILDDILLYRFHQKHFLVVANAANTEKIWNWMQEQLDGQVEIKNQSEQIGLLALQGPKAETILQKLTKIPLGTISRHRFLEGQTIGGCYPVLVSRTGYTGEDGFELYIEAEQTRSLWDHLYPILKEMGGLPCGLGARDTLRLEAGLPLYGQELSETISPLEAGLGFAVKLQKEIDFIGKKALLEQKKKGIKRKSIGFVLLERGIPRTGYTVFSEDGKEIGEVTSGTQSPVLEKGIGLALVQTEYARTGMSLSIAVRNKMLRAETVRKPFIQQQK